MAVSNLESKLEQAFVNFLVAQTALGTLGLSFFTGVEDDEQICPCVVAHCQGGPEEPQGFGNYMMEVSVWIKTKLQKSNPENPTEDRLAAHNALVAPVRDALSTDDLATQLTAAGGSDFYVFDPVIGGPTQNTTEGGFAKTLKQFRVYCCAANIS